MTTTRRHAVLSAALGGAALLALAGPEAASADDGSGDLVVNARTDGAVGDGRTDDAPALNASVRRLADAGGGVLLLPRGSYLLGSSLLLRSGVSVISGAAGHGYVAGGRTAAVVLVGGAGRSGAVVDTPDGETVVGAHLSGVDVQGGGAAVGVRLQDASWCSVTRVSVNGCSGPGVTVGAGMACVLEDLLLTNCVTAGGADGTTGVLDVAGTDHYVSRCEASGSLKAKTSADKHVAAIVVRGANHFVSDSVGEYADAGIVVTADSSRFSNVRADTNLGDGWVVRGAGNAFAACSAIGNSQDASGVDDGWVVTGGGNTFAACNVVTSSSKQVRYGFRDTVNTKAAQDRNTYSGCTVDTAASAPWSTEGYLGSSPAVPANAIRPADGTAVIDVGQAGLVVLFDYRTPTLVTGFSGGVTGQSIRVLGAGAVTIDANPSIRTSSGLPTPMLADRVMTFVAYDGVWYQTD